MTTTPVTAPTTTTPSLYTTGSKATVPKQQFDKEVFLNLLVAQLRNQDPSSPMDTTEMMSQSSQLASMEKLTELTDTGRESFALLQFDLSPVRGLIVTRATLRIHRNPDPVPLHREPLFGIRPDLVDKYPTHDDKKAFWRLPTLYKSVQEKNKDIGKQFPLIMSSGRLVEYEGGGEETRSNPWLAELQQEMFVEINPKAAADRGIRNGDRVWLLGATGARLNVQALVTERVGPDTVWMPFHFSGRWQGTDLLPYYPAGAHPVVRGEAVNTATTYGYDSVTMMQETKTTVCQVEKAA